MVISAISEITVNSRGLCYVLFAIGRMKKINNMEWELHKTKSGRNKELRYKIKRKNCYNAIFKERKSTSNRWQKIKLTRFSQYFEQLLWEEEKHSYTYS